MQVVLHQLLLEGLEEQASKGSAAAADNDHQGIAVAMDRLAPLPERRYFWRYLEPGTVTVNGSV